MLPYIYTILKPPLYGGGLLLAIPSVDVGLQFADFILCERGAAGHLLIVFEECREEVFHGLALGVAHGVDGGIYAFGKQLELQSVAPSVAAYDAAYLPEAEFVEKFTAGYSYLAHEQLVDVVDGQEFFPSVPFLSSGSPSGMW